MSVVVVRHTRPVVKVTRTQTAIKVTATRGPVGPEGPEGPPGPAGAAPQSYTHAQGTVQQVWTVQHNLGYRPAGLWVTDQQGRRRFPDVVHLSINVMTLTFVEAVSGTADVS